MSEYLKKKPVFEKGYTPRWTEEVFQVSSVLETVPVTYKLIDLNSSPIIGSFYEQELQKTDQNVYRIEKVLKKKKNKVLVKWMGYDSDFNSWIDADSVNKL